MWNGVIILKHSRKPPFSSSDMHEERTQPDRLPAWPQTLGANSSNNDLGQSASTRITGESIDQDKKDSAAEFDP